MEYIDGIPFAQALGVGAATRALNKGRWREDVHYHRATVPTLAAVVSRLFSLF